jgi:hypothetical protein
MENYLLANKIIANTETAKACINLLHTPTPEPGFDHVLTLSRDEITHCPGCGEWIEVFTLPLPAPVSYTRALATGGSCNDRQCPFHNKDTVTCTLAQGFLSLGCWMLNPDVRDIIRDLKVSIKANVDETTKEGLPP